MNIFVIGDENAILGFSLVGIEGQVVRSLDEAKKALNDALANKDLKILLITEDWAAKMQDRVDELKMKSRQPLVLDIPGPGTQHQGETLRELVEKVIGIPIAKDGGQ
jgi:V/A-type H+-transporting ATPase subunit F